jgi:hypothetical protein
VVADLWAVGRIGIAAPLGLLAVVSLPRPFVFRVNVDDPHPPPWIRVKLSCAMGAALYPHPQWAALATAWEALYPPAPLTPALRATFSALEATLPALVALLVNHRPASLQGRSIGEELASADRTPARLSALFARGASALERARPALAFAAVGQARADGRVTPERESALLSSLLTRWALADVLASPPSRQPVQALAVHVAAH